MVTETITAKGHSLVKGTHKTTIELTKESHLTPRGDCIIGVSADKACVDLSEELKAQLREDKKFTIVLKVSSLEEKITGFGSPDLKLTNTHDIVLRKSSHIDGRTLLVKCNKACGDLSREFVNKLKNPYAKVEMTI